MAVVVQEGHEQGKNLFDEIVDDCRDVGLVLWGDKFTTSVVFMVQT